MAETLIKKEEEKKSRFEALKEEIENNSSYDEYEYQDDDEDFTGILPERNFKRNLGC